MSSIPKFLPLSVVEVDNPKLKTHGQQGIVTYEYALSLYYYEDIEDYKFPENDLVNVVFNNGKRVHVKNENLKLVHNYQFDKSSFKPGTYVWVTHSTDIDSLCGIVLDDPIDSRTGFIKVKYYSLNGGGFIYDKIWFHPYKLKPVNTSNANELNKFERKIRLIEQHDRKRKEHHRLEEQVVLELDVTFNKLINTAENKGQDSLYNSPVLERYWPKHSLNQSDFIGNKVSLICKVKEIDSLVSKLLKDGYITNDQIKVYKLGAPSYLPFTFKVDTSSLIES